MEPSWSWSIARFSRSERRNDSSSSMISARSRPRSESRRCSRCSPGNAFGTSRGGASRRAAAEGRARAATGNRREPAPRAPARSRAGQPECSVRGCTATRRSRSSSIEGTHGCSRPDRCGRCRGSTVPGAGFSDPIARSCHGRSRYAPWLGIFPRRAGRRRTPRRNLQR